MDKIIQIVLIIGIPILMFIFPYFRCVMKNIPSVLFYLPRDIYLYFKRKKYNNATVGILVAVLGYFGRGKTLTTVYMVVNEYMSKNGKMVWCPRRKKMVRQRVHIISNIKLNGVPYEKFVSLDQIVYASDNNKAYDDEHNCLTVTLVIGDEFSSQMNSRTFKNNIDPLTLSAILSCRHNYIAFYYTSQRFNLTDALLRQVTSYCISCYKIWRLQGITYYDAWQLENAASPLLVEPYKRDCWFVKDKHYNAYDTLENVENIKKAVSAGDMITEEEIIALQMGNAPDMGQVMKPSRKYKHVQKRMYK